MAAPELEIVLEPDGTVTVEVTGAPGAECLDYADLVRDILGREEHRELTAEYYRDGDVRMNVEVRNRHE